MVKGSVAGRPLLARTRFICRSATRGSRGTETCQLHRPGHNLPWKLRREQQRQVRHRVYLCPEATCRPPPPLARPRRDLTGIKKHCCQQATARRRVGSATSAPALRRPDPTSRAHARTAAPASNAANAEPILRRDSFITHRAFCAPWRQESSRPPTAASTSWQPSLRNPTTEVLSLSSINVPSASTASPKPCAYPTFSPPQEAPIQLDHLISSATPSVVPTPQLLHRPAFYP
ncbi:hypothetical protein C4D60_Mb00t19690 [Musa balbisiana]|uniref:BIRD-IDD transcription factor fourth C2HC zinc finger domain-containing protein n=1 Tax=Musa balbisiana TaxID=52838 RepID=A0A4S8I3H6_MUSBA|nr:hypothetical protein C4D60_Mb00t19690 [Musa balbisiana]